MLNFEVPCILVASQGFEESRFWPAIKTRKITEEVAPMKESVQWDALAESSQDAVMRAVKNNTDLQAQLNWLENHRWKQVKLDMISEEEITKACVSNGANIEAVKVALPVVAKATRRVEMEQIRKLTGLPAEPTVRAVSALLNIPYSWRGINPRRPNRPEREKKTFGNKYDRVAVPMVAKLSEVSDSEIILAANENKTTPTAIRAILPVVEEAFKKPRVITRKEIREITGQDALPIMKALSNLLSIPYSLRGFNPARILQKDMCAKGKPLHYGNSRSDFQWN
jgi:hypothetical protein